jgi:hypothetical protein
MADEKPGTEQGPGVLKAINVMEVSDARRVRFFRVQPVVRFDG